MGGCKYAAIIPAAGFSSRMGAFKPLLMIDGKPAVERAVNTFKKAGISDIRVVVGHNAQLLYPILSRLDVKAILNPDYERGMYSSIMTGVSSLENGIDAFFLLPADYPMVRHNTVSVLKSHYENGFRGVLYPCHNGRRGHPPLLPVAIKKEILKADVEGGLKKLLSSLPLEKKNINVDDEGILIDMDTRKDYEDVLNGTYF